MISGACYITREAFSNRVLAVRSWFAISGVDYAERRPILFFRGDVKLTWRAVVPTRREHGVCMTFIDCDYAFVW